MIEQPLSLPCGVTLANRLCKSAMTEGLATPAGRATPAHQRLYAAWAAGGAALQVSGHSMIDRRYLERAGLASQPSLSPWAALLGHLGKDFGHAMARKIA